MEIVGLKRLDDAKKKFGDIRTVLDCWTSEVRDASWNSPQDIKEKYSSASILEYKKVFFNIKGNNYRLLTQVDYQLKIVIIEWIGTHAEYTKKYC